MAKLSSSSCFHDRTTGRSGTEIDLRSLWFSVFQDVSLKDLLLVPA